MCVLPWKIGVLPWAIGVLPWKFGVLPWKMGVLPWKIGVLPWKFGVLPWKMNVLPWKCVFYHENGWFEEQWMGDFGLGSWESGWRLRRIYGVWRMNKGGLTSDN